MPSAISLNHLRVSHPGTFRLVLSINVTCMSINLLVYYKKATRQKDSLIPRLPDLLRNKEASCTPCAWPSGPRAIRQQVPWICLYTLKIHLAAGIDGSSYLKGILPISVMLHGTLAHQQQIPGPPSKTNPWGGGDVPEWEAYHITPDLKSWKWWKLRKDCYSIFH